MHVCSHYNFLNYPTSSAPIKNDNSHNSNNPHTATLTLSRQGHVNSTKYQPDLLLTSPTV